MTFGTSAAAPTIPHASAAPVVLCADDYGMRPGVSRAIGELLEAGVLTATSCMSASPHWRAQARDLAGFRARVDLGLHLMLTDGRPLGPMPCLAPGGTLPTLGTLIRRVSSGSVPHDELMNELTRQLDAFEDAVGMVPDFVDGHHHVHQLPVIRDVVVRLFDRRLSGGRTYLRTCHERVGVLVARGVAVGRALGIGWLGAALQRRAQRHNIPTNDGFSGLYNFASNEPYATLFERFLVAGRATTVVVCHPGVLDDAACGADRIAARREEEYRYLASPACAAAVAASGVRLSRFR